MNGISEGRKRFETDAEIKMRPNGGAPLGLVSAVRVAPFYLRAVAILSNSFWRR